MAELHPQAPSGSSLYQSASFDQSRFVSKGDMTAFPRRLKSLAGVVANRPLVKNDNQDPARQSIAGVNGEADLSAVKAVYRPDVDSILPYRILHNGAYEWGDQLGTTAGAGTVATNGTTAIVGTLSSFTADLVGQYISIVGEPKPLKVAEYTDATHITAATAASTTASGKAWKYASLPVFKIDMHPIEPNEAAPRAFVATMDWEASDGDGYPVVIFFGEQQDIEIKIQNGNLTEVAENWMFCYDGYASDAALLNEISAYTGSPVVFGHFTDANAAKLPLHIKITTAAGSTYDGKFKTAFTRTLTGTWETDGTDTIQGTGTAATTELAVGDEIYIEGETAPLIVESITDNDTVVLTTSASTTDTGLSATASTFAGAEISFKFDIPAEVKVNDILVGNDRSDSVWITFQSGHGTVSVGDEWGFTEPRVLPTPSYSKRDVLHGAGLKITIDDVPYGGVPGFPGVHDASIKLTIPKKPNKTTGSKYAEGIQSNGRAMGSVTFNRDRTDRTFLKKLIAASKIAVTLEMNGNALGLTGYYDQWVITAAHAQISKLTRDNTTENTLPEQIEVEFVRADDEDGDPVSIWTESITCTVSESAIDSTVTL